MKKLISILFFSTSFIFLNAQADSLKTVVTTLDIKGTSYTVCQKFPEEIIGEYLKGKKGNPMTFLNHDGTGYFQMTGKPNAIKFWIDCNEKGEVKKTWLFDGNFTVMVTFQYTDEAVRAVWGEYDRIEIKVAYDQGYAIIHQERYHNIRNK
jgi:hypothetical protein